jgi:hypothetical protein
LLSSFYSCEDDYQQAESAVEVLESVSSGKPFSGQNVTRSHVESEYPYDSVAGNDTYDPSCFNYKSVNKGEQKLYSDLAKMGGDPRALKQAICFMERHKETEFEVQSGADSAKIGDRCKLVINDFSKSNSPNYRKNVMYRINRCTGEIDKSMVTQGRNGVGDDAVGKSANKDSSNATLRGFHLLGGPHYGKKFKGIKIHGLQRGINSNCYKKAVVVHASDYVSNTDAGRSLGCPALKQSEYNEMRSEYMGQEGSRKNDDQVQGILMYNYTRTERAKGEGYCGDNVWEN